MAKLQTGKSGLSSCCSDEPGILPPPPFFAATAVAFVTLWESIPVGLVNTDDTAGDAKSNPVLAACVNDVTPGVEIVNVLKVVGVGLAVNGGVMVMVVAGAVEKLVGDEMRIFETGSKAAEPSMVMVTTLNAIQRDSFTLWGTLNPN